MVVLVGVGKGGLRAPYVPLEMTLSAFLVVRVLGQSCSQPWSVCPALTSMQCPLSRYKQIIMFQI